MVLALSIGSEPPLKKNIFFWFFLIAKNVFFREKTYTRICNGSRTKYGKNVLVGRSGSTQAQLVSKLELHFANKRITSLPGGR